MMSKSKDVEKREKKNEEETLTKQISRKSVSFQSLKIFKTKRKKKRRLLNKEEN